MSRARTRCLMAVLFASSPGSYIDEEMPSVVVDGDGVEEEGAGGIVASGGWVGGILRARDVSSMYRSAAILRKLEDASENVVGGPIGAAPFPPSFDDSMVVPVDDNMVALICDGEYVCGEEFKGDSFGPLDVPPLGLPAGCQPPRSPSRAHRDCHADTRTCV